MIPTSGTTLAREHTTESMTHITEKLHGKMHALQKCQYGAVMESSDRELAKYATTMPADIETVAGEVTGREVVTGKEQGEEATTIKAIYKEKILVTNGETGEATTRAV